MVMEPRSMHTPSPSERAHRAGLRAFAYAMHGGVGYILGGYTAKRGLPDSGKFTLTLRKGADGRWLIMSDMDNSNNR